MTQMINYSLSYEMLCNIYVSCYVSVILDDFRNASVHQSKHT